MDLDEIIFNVIGRYTFIGNNKGIILDIEFEQITFKFLLAR